MKETRTAPPFIMEGPPRTETVINGNKYLYFAGTGYFQLHSHPEVIRAAVDAVTRYGISSATSRSFAGTTPLTLELEREAAEFFGKEDAVYLPSGYLCDTAGIAALRQMGRAEVIFIDESAHYSNFEGARASMLPIITFRSNDIEDLREKIGANLARGQKPLLVTDGLFSTFGIPADIPGLLAVAEEYDGTVWVDDAHAAGIAGPSGRGIFDHFGLDSRRLYCGATMSKAFGGYGGMIAGDGEFISIIKSSGTFVGGTPAPAPAAGASLQGLRLVSSSPGMRDELRSNARYLKQGLRRIGIDAGESYFPIAAFPMGTVDDMKRIHARLLDKGIFIQLSNYAGSGDGALRMVVTSAHTKEHIDKLVASISEAIGEVMR